LKVWSLIKFSTGFGIPYGCHTDNGGILVLFEKLSGKDVSFVDMTALEASPTRLSLVTASLPIFFGTEGEGSLVSFMDST
jgi:hypothetical protein